MQEHFDVENPIVAQEVNISVENIGTENVPNDAVEALFAFDLASISMSCFTDIWEILLAGLHYYILTIYTLADFNNAPFFVQLADVLALTGLIHSCFMVVLVLLSFLSVTGLEFACLRVCIKIFSAGLYGCMNASILCVAIMFFEVQSFLKLNNHIWGTHYHLATHYSLKHWSVVYLFIQVFIFTLSAIGGTLVAGTIASFGKNVDSAIERHHGNGFYSKFLAFSKNMLDSEALNAKLKLAMVYGMIAAGCMIPAVFALAFLFIILPF